MNDISVYEYQLEQVNHSLVEDPNNEDLLKLKQELEEIIQLTRELNEGNQLQGVKRKKSNVFAEAKNKDNATNSTTTTTTTTDRNDGSKTLSTSQPQVSSGAATNKMWKLGELCEVKLPEYNYQWIEGTITSLSSDKTHVTLMLTKTADTKYIPISQIRSPIHAPIVMEEPIKIHGREKEATSIETRKKRMKSRQDYIERKEAEHYEKSNDWKNFKTKLVKKTTPSLFKPNYNLDKHKSIFKTEDVQLGKIKENVKKGKEIYMDLP